MNEKLLSIFFSSTSSKENKNKFYGIRKNQGIKIKVKEREKIILQFNIKPFRIKLD